MDEEKYIDWFNKGYALAKDKPTLANNIIAALDKKDDTRAKGFIDGHKEYLHEQEHAKEISEFKKHRNYIPRTNNSPTPGKDKDRDKEKD